MNTLSQLRCCIEKPLEKDVERLKHIRQQSKSDKHFKKLKASFYTEKLWPTGAKIKISFVSTPDAPKPSWTPLTVMKNKRGPDGKPMKMDPLENTVRSLSPKEAVKLIVEKRIKPLVNLEIDFVDDGGDVRVGFIPDSGAWSLIGTDCLSSSEKQTMNLGWLDVTTVCHEFGHMLGLIHEHQNPRGKPIDWNEEAVYKWANATQGWDKETTYHNIIQKYSVGQTNGSGFDPESIMLYFFPAQLTNNNEGTQQNLIFSPIDVVYITKQYAVSRKEGENFYSTAYNLNLSEELKQYNDEGSSKIKNAMKIILIILACFLVGFGVAYFVRKMKK